MADTSVPSAATASGYSAGFAVQHFAVCRGRYDSAVVAGQRQLSSTTIARRSASDHAGVDRHLGAGVNRRAWRLIIHFRNPSPARHGPSRVFLAIAVPALHQPDLPEELTADFPTRFDHGSAARLFQQAQLAMVKHAPRRDQA